MTILIPEKAQNYWWPEKFVPIEPRTWVDDARDYAIAAAIVLVAIVVLWLLWRIAPHVWRLGVRVAARKLARVIGRLKVWWLRDA